MHCSLGIPEIPEEESEKLKKERRRNERIIQERNRDLEILNRVGLEIASRLDLREILTRVVKNAVEMVKGDAGGIAFYDEREKQIKYPHTYNMPEGLERVIVTKAGWFMTHIMDTKESVIIEDYPASRLAIKEFVDAGIKSMVLVPISTKGMSFGILAVFSLTPGKRLNERGLWLLEGVGREAAIAIENARLFEEARERARRAEAAYEISRIFNSTLELSEVLRLVINEISSAIGTEIGGIFFYRPDEDKFYGKMGYGPALQHVQDIVEDADKFLLADEAVKTKDIVVVMNARTDPRAPRRYVKMFDMRSIIVLPLVVKDNVIGVIALGHTEEEHRFGEDEITFAKSIALQAAIAIENARLYESEHYVADVLQRSFLPENIPEIPNTQIAVFYTTASQAGRVGGDFYDFIRLTGDRIGIVVGDVSGKGIEVASTTALAKYTVRAFAFEDEKTTSTLEQTNKVIAREIEAGHFITLVYIIYDWQSGQISVSSAGHPYPIHYVAREAKSYLIESKNAALGILPELKFTEKVEKLDTGDILILYTDGLIESRRDSQFYGTDRLMQIMDEVAQLSANGIVNRIVEDVNSFTQGRLRDDIALSVLKRERL